MATHQGINKLPSHVAVPPPPPHHNSISDFSIDSISLSFAGLVSVQDQQISSSVPNNQDEHYSKLSKLAVPDPPFEFATTNNKSVSNSASSPINRIRPADVLISNGKIVPQALPPSQLPNRSFISSNNPQGSLRTFLASDNQHHHHHHHNIRSNKMPKPKGETGKANRKYYEPLGKDRNEEMKSEKEEERRGIGKKMLNSFLAPCRECKAIQPGTVKGGRETSSKYN